MEENKTAKNPQILWAEIVAKTWMDEEFKKKLLDNPKGVMAAAGLELPEGVEYKIIEPSPADMYVVLPAKDAQDVLREVMNGMYEVAEETGVIVPEDCELRIVQNTEKVNYLVLPEPPTDELSDEQLDQISGGKYPWKMFWGTIKKAAKGITNKHFIKGILYKNGMPEVLKVKTSIAVYATGAIATNVGAVTHSVEASAVAVAAHAVGVSEAIVGVVLVVI